MCVCIYIVFITSFVMKKITHNHAGDMRRNCNLELRLEPPSPQFHLRQENPSENISIVGGYLKEKQNQQLTIFYDGRVCVCDVTELQVIFKHWLTYALFLRKYVTIIICI
ncbi:putative transcription factor TIFY family [Helianthus anomalus]